jgi:putative transposase
MADHPPLTHLTEAQRALAFARFARLRPHLEEDIPLTQVAEEAQIPLRTAQRWVTRYRQHGLAGLVRPHRKDAGTHRLPAALQELIEGLALQKPALSAAAIQRQVIAVADQHGWARPSYDQVYAIVRHLDPAVVTLAHEGTKAYRDRFDLLYRREASMPNEIWQADHTPLDLWILDEKGQPARSWLTVILDDYSRAVAGYRLGFEAPSALRTALTLRQAIWPKGDAHWPMCGIPATFYTDHGSDFTSQHLEQVAADLKMRLVFSLPGMPRGRGRIERFFATLNQLFLCLLPGYAPAGTPSPPKPTLTLPTLAARLHDFIATQYHERIHGETGMAPKARWAAQGFLPRLPDTLEQLDLLLLTVPKPRQVHRDGIHFAGHRYLDLTLAAYVGETVTVRYDPQDLAELRVHFRDQFLCRAVCSDLAGQTLSLKDLIHTRNARRRELRQLVVARRNIADELLAERELQSRPEQADAPRPRLKRYLND